MSDIDDATRTAVAQLGRAIGDRPPPCWTRPDAWFAANPDTAIRPCLTDCHALPECAAYTDIIEPSCGVWAGRLIGKTP